MSEHTGPAEDAAAPRQSAAAPALDSVSEQLRPPSFAGHVARSSPDAAVAALSPATLLSLQRSAGNQAVTRWIEGGLATRQPLHLLRTPSTTGRAAGTDDIDERAARISPAYVDNAAVEVTLIPEGGGLMSVVNPKFVAILVEFEDGSAMTVPLDSRRLLGPKAPTEIEVRRFRAESVAGKIVPLVWRGDAAALTKLTPDSGQPGFSKELTPRIMALYDRALLHTAFTYSMLAVAVWNAGLVLRDAVRFIAVAAMASVRAPIKGGKSGTPGGKTETPGGKTETPGGKTETPGAKTETPGAKTETPGGEKTPEAKKPQQTAAERDWEKAEAEAKRQNAEADEPARAEHGAIGERFDTPEAAVGQVEGELKIVDKVDTVNEGLKAQGYTKTWYVVDKNGVQWTVAHNPRTGKFAAAHHSSSNR
jgi:hypothetical protein